VLDAAGWKRGRRRRAREGGRKLKFLFQTATNSPRQKTQAIIKQACQKAGIELELKAVVASVFFSTDEATPTPTPSSSPTCRCTAPTCASPTRTSS
jgi:peptide/nickel transport system substrate-binding protein